MHIEYTKRSWVSRSREKKMPDFVHFVPFLLILADYFLMYQSLRIAYETAGNVSFTAAYCAVGALLVSLAGIWAGIVSWKRISEKKWIPAISFVFHGLILLFVLIIIGMGL